MLEMGDLFYTLASRDQKELLFAHLKEGGSDHRDYKRCILFAKRGLAECDSSSCLRGLSCLMPPHSSRK
jgi:hypothetical protein